MDDDEIWKEKRRQTTEHKMAAAEKAKQRKEEEEKRYEESRAKKSNKDLSDLHSSMSSSFNEWDKEERAKSSENFKQMTQVICFIYILNLSNFKRQNPVCCLSLLCFLTIEKHNAYVCTYCKCLRLHLLQYYLCK